MIRTESSYTKGEMKMKITNKITRPIVVSCTALALIFGSLTKEVNALTGEGGSTGWNSVSTTDVESCQAKASQKMNTLVAGGEIQTIPGWSSRFRRGNNVIFNVVCDRSGKNVRVDVICFNTCDRYTYNLRTAIDNLMNW